MTPMAGGRASAATITGSRAGFPNRPPQSLAADPSLEVAALTARNVGRFGGSGRRFRRQLIRRLLLEPPGREADPLAARVDFEHLDFDHLADVGDFGHPLDPLVIELADVDQPFRYRARAPDERAERLDAADTAAVTFAPLAYLSSACAHGLLASCRMRRGRSSSSPGRSSGP